MSFLRYFGGYLLQILPFAFLCFYPVSSTFRLPKAQLYLVTMAFEVIMASLFSISYLLLSARSSMAPMTLANICFMTSLLVQTAFYILIVKENIWNKLFYFSFTLLSALYVTSLANFIQNYFFHLSLEGAPPYAPSGYFFLFLVTAAAFPMLLHIEQRLGRIVSQTFSIRDSRRMFALSLILFILLGSGLIFIDSTYMENPMTLFLFVCVYILTYFIYYIFVRTIQESKEKTEALNRIRQVENQISIANTQYQWMNSMVEQDRKTRHDFRHHMVVLNGMFQQDNRQEASEYIRQYLQEDQQESYTPLCTNPVVDTLLNYYSAKCRHLGIKFQLLHVKKQLVPPEGFGDIRSTDLAAILGNLLENAMAAVSRLEPGEAFIQVGIAARGSILIITIDNAFDGTVRLQGGAYESTKEGHAAIGLKSISLLAERYDGGCDFSHTENVFHASVMLQYPPLNGETV